MVTNCVGVGAGGSGRRVLPRQRAYRRSSAGVDDFHLLVADVVHSGRGSYLGSPYSAT
ncbi:hypothetical protein OS965_34525 [Streptomyces sp. H27-G5]|uniref:hypothetical protein n=1 Tax=Streptomyces sp. H27-G5 TaxID=2996698 RepID=UPI002270553A|nr:hypothetical protein [Streptomyces sp. H27-G5]MCY0923195.1 hypothetical protein [Streptomyces sp. H27-G5]